MIKYNPFNKNISKLTAKDLNKLIEKEISEGWYIEYKSQFVELKKIAKSIASFANSDGGWYFIGINDDENNSAKEIIGFELSENKQPKEKIRNIIKEHICPIPYFESKLIKIDTNKYVMAILIEKGMETPYVTKDGKIYIRTSEGSDPIKGADRYIIEKLFERSKENIIQIENFSKNLFLIKENKLSRNLPFIEMYCYPHPFNSFSFSNYFKKGFFNTLKKNFKIPIELVKKVKINIDLSDFYSSYDSYIVRNHTFRNRIDFKSSQTLEIFRNGNGKIFSPIPNITYTKTNGTINFNTIKPRNYLKSNNLKSFILKLNKKTNDDLYIIDSYSLLLSLGIIFKQYLRLLKNNNYKKSIKFRLKLKNIENCLLYFDCDGYLKYIDENGWPISFKSELEIPTFINGKSFELNIKKDLAKYFICLIQIVFEALGLPTVYYKDAIFGIGDYVANIIKEKQLDSLND